MKRYKFLLISFFIIAFIISACTKSRKADLEVNNFYDFGKVYVGKDYQHTFKIKNISQTDLKIIKIGTSCGCTAAIISDSIIKQNEEAEINVKFKPIVEKLGLVENSIVFESNAVNPYTVLKIKADVSVK